VSADPVLGGEQGHGRGFHQMMDGVEVGRVNVAVRARGLSIRAFELAVAYAQQRRKSVKQIADHQAIAFKLAEIATNVEASHLLIVSAARLKDSSARNDVEAGMANLLARRRGDPGVVPYPRRLWVLEGVRDRSADARSIVIAARRGHVRDSEDDDQPQPTQGVSRRAVVSSGVLFLTGAGWRLTAALGRF
jgi:hypothetical protein